MGGNRGRHFHYYFHYRGNPENNSDGADLPQIRVLDEHLEYA
jgi:hypothetical protein